MSFILALEHNVDELLEHLESLYLEILRILILRLCSTKCNCLHTLVLNDDCAESLNICIEETYTCRSSCSYLL